MVGKNFQKIDFFRFFEKCFKSYLGIIHGLETGFKHFGGEFDAIFDDLYVIQTNLKKINFLKKNGFFAIFR